MKGINCFKAYDVRGRVPEDLDEDIAYRIGRAYAAHIAPQTVTVGRDVRSSSPALSAALTSGLTDSGVDVVDIGICGTEQVYFATFHRGLDGGIMVTASHNPRDHNGMKMVKTGARPISADTGLEDIRRIAESGEFPQAARHGSVNRQSITGDYIDHVLGYIDTGALKPLRIVVNAGNGCAGPVVDLLEPHLPFEFVKLQHEPDGTFPNGVPNPMLARYRGATSAAVLESRADLGIAWDGDFDRCFFFDENGAFIEGYYIVGLLALAFLKKSPGDRIVHDPRLTWNTIDAVERAGGRPVQSKSGHAFIKQTMRDVDAVYGGEMSAHHYFRDFSYADSGMIPWLLIAEIISRRGVPLSELVTDRIAMFPTSGEINRRVENTAETIARLESQYAVRALSTEHVDGISVTFADWRFNVRASNTEPLLRLNVESSADTELMRTRTEELLELIGGEPG
ncbi:phosphomannomutase [Candidatus Rariloculus sp.]|uniref:phosphomannomutase n=1 Tax=Candidatus Rariloculus sp. TaxID=3101265 RepID=UPI003D0AE135